MPLFTIRIFRKLVNRLYESERNVLDHWLAAAMLGKPNLKQRYQKPSALLGLATLAQEYSGEEDVTLIGQWWHGVGMLGGRAPPACTFKV